MNKNYMIPANSKKSQLILGFFTTTDLIIFGSGAIVSMTLLFAIPNPDLPTMIIMLLPILVTAFLVMPVVHYHNILQFLTNIFSFYFGKRRYYWKGWCIQDESKIK